MVRLWNSPSRTTGVRALAEIVGDEQLSSLGPKNRSEPA
jgi:hypothetical protein